MPFGVEELRAATNELIRRNGLASCYIRPIAFRGYGEMGLFAESPVEVTIATWPWGAYLGEEGKRTGIKAKVSSWRRISPDGLIPHAKASGQYLNSILAKTEAHNSGYQEAILLDQRGMVCEGSGENIFVVREGRDPDPAAHGLDPRRHQPQLGHPDRADLGYTVVERDIGRSELYLADEIFLTGTAAELVPVREIDDHAIDGSRGDHERDRRASSTTPCTAALPSTRSGWIRWTNPVKSFPDAIRARTRSPRAGPARRRITGSAAA